MRSCQISVSPKFNDWYPFKESYLERETQSRDITQMEEGHVMTEEEIGVMQMQGRNTNICW